MSEHRALQSAFATTDYQVTIQAVPLVFRVDRGLPPPLARWVGAHAGRASAWLITAHNPGGRRIEAGTNAARAALLDTLLDRHGLSRLPAVNRDPEGGWPDEHGWLVAGLEEGRARALGRRFGQAALVAVGTGTARLVWIDPAGTD